MSRQDGQRSKKMRNFHKKEMRLIQAISRKITTEITPEERIAEFIKKKINIEPQRG